MCLEEGLQRCVINISSVFSVIMGNFYFVYALSSERIPFM